MPFTRHCVRLLLAGLMLAVALPAMAEAWPARPITMIIPFPPGGTLDAIGRMLAGKLSTQLGQNVIVENRAGGGGTIGATQVAKAKPDGYTLLFSASTFTTAPILLKAPFQIERDFQPISLVAKAPLTVSVSNKLPVTDLKGLIAYGKANPGKLTFAIGSAGSAGHLSTELLKKSSGIEYLIIPYKGSTPAYQDVMGGQIDGFIDPILGSSALAKGGKLKILAVTSKARVQALPDVPTVAETIPGYEFYSWYGLWGPAKLPLEMTRRLNEEVNKALSGSDMRQTFEPQGLQLTPGSSEDFARFQKDDIARSAKIIADGKIRAE